MVLNQTTSTPGAKWWAYQEYVKGLAEPGINGYEVLIIVTIVVIILWLRKNDIFFSGKQ